MTVTALPSIPVQDQITIAQLTENPYAIYKRLRAEAPVARIPSIQRILLTKAADTKHVKENWELFSSDDPRTPMTRAFQAQTLMRKDGEAHKRERNAMAPAFAPATSPDAGKSSIPKWRRTMSEACSVAKPLISLLPWLRPMRRAV